MKLVTNVLSNILKLKIPLPSARNLVTQLLREGYRVGFEDAMRLRDTAESKGITITRQLAKSPDHIFRPYEMIRGPEGMSRNYLYEVSVEVEDYNTDEWTRKTFRMVYDNQLSTKDVLNKFMEMHGNAFDDDRTDWSTLRFEGAYYRR